MYFDFDKIGASGLLDEVLNKPEKTLIRRTWRRSGFLWPELNGYCGRDRCDSAVGCDGRVCASELHICIKRQRIGVRLQITEPFAECLLPRVSDGGQLRVTLKELLNVLLRPKGLKLFDFTIHPQHPRCG